MLEKRINDDYIQAMKARDILRSSTLSFLRAGLKNVMVDKKTAQLDDADVLAVIKKQIKQRQDSIEQYEKGGREDLALKEKNEMAVLKAYLPQEMPAEELAALVGGVIAELQASGMKDMGRVMKAAAEKAAGRADNRDISQRVREALSKL